MHGSLTATDSSPHLNAARRAYFLPNLPEVSGTTCANEGANVLAAERRLR